MTTANDTAALVPWEPDRTLTALGAQRLTMYLVAKAEKLIKDERERGAEYPPEGTPAHEACIAELAYQYAETVIGAGEASQLQIVDWIARESLYLHHPRQWETLEQMLLDIANGLSSVSGKSVYTRLATKILPYVRKHGIADAVDIMAVIVEPEGGRGKLYHALPMLSQAIDEDDTETVRGILDDVADRSVTRPTLLSKWREKTPIQPARAHLYRNSHGEWHLEVIMDDEQKRLVLGRLGDRVHYEQSPYDQTTTLERLYPDEP